MPSTRSVAASQSCLQCQLRQVILRTRQSVARRCFLQHANERGRGLHVSARRSQAAEDQEQGAFLKNDSRDDKRKAIYRREYPIGRIVGQPGRRQRESSETLKIDSMRRPFDVVLMQDVPQSKDKKSIRSNEVSQESNDRSALSHTQLSSELLKQDGRPNQDEVNESIDALRPNANMVDHQQYRRLLEQLSHGYNTEQLSSYLKKYSKRLSLVEDDAHAMPKSSAKGTGNLKRSTWRPGRTAMEKRHGVAISLKRNKLGFNKKRIIEQILQHVWNMTIHSEEQQIGELEISLQTWQIQYLFHLRQDDKPNYQHIIQLPLLLRNSEVLLYRPDTVVRIIARRQDAEEIAGLFQKELSEVGKLVLDLGIFKPLLGTPGWPESHEKMFPEADLDYVAQHTANAIERKDDKTICIYNKSETVRQHGKRLLLSLLALPFPGSSKMLDVKAAYNSSGEDVTGGEPIPLPEGAVSSLHFRYHGIPLSRFATPAHRFDADGRSADESYPQSKVQQNYDRSVFAAEVADKLSSQASKSLEISNFAFNSSSSSYWETTSNLDSLPLEVQFCKILQASDSTQNARAARRSTLARQQLWNHKTVVSTVQPEVPGINTLLTYFSPCDQGFYAFDNSPNPPRLVAHFFPSPYTSGGVDAMRNLPPIELWYDFASGENNPRSTDRRILRLSSVRAILYLEELQIPLPSDAVDIRVLRKLPLIANPDRILEDEETMQFTDALQQSASSGSGALEGPATIKVKLPYSVAKRADLERQEPASNEDVEIEYCFARFEQIQTAPFVPIQSNGLPEPVDPAMEQVLNGMPGSSFLEYKVIEGGVLEGSRAELSLKYKADTVSAGVGLDRSNTETVDEATRRANLQLVETALWLATSLTQINNGTLQPPRTTREDDEERARPY